MRVAKQVLFLLSRLLKQRPQACFWILADVNLPVHLLGADVALDARGKEGVVSVRRQRPHVGATEVLHGVRFALG